MTVCGGHCLVTRLDLLKLKLIKAPNLPLLEEVNLNLFTKNTHHGRRKGRVLGKLGESSGHAHDGNRDKYRSYQKLFPVWLENFQRK